MEENATFNEKSNLKNELFTNMVCIKTLKSNYVKIVMQGLHNSKNNFNENEVEDFQILFLFLENLT